MKHKTSMYATKDAMIEAMRSEIDSLETQLAEARKDSERLDFMCKKTKYGTYPLVTFMIKKYIIEVEILGGYKTLGLGSTPREAIDAAMKGGE